MSDGLGGKMNINKLKGVGEKTAELFHKIGIYTTQDLISCYPRNYDIYEKPILIKEIGEQTTIAVKGVVAKNTELKRVRNLQILSTYIRDTEGDLIKVTWFNMPFLKNQLKIGYHYIFRGRVTVKIGALVIEQPILYSEEQYALKLNEMQPIYHLTKGLTNNIVSKSVRQVLDQEIVQKEYLPLDLRKKYQLAEYNFAIKNIHFPANKEDFIAARSRLVFDEFFLFIATLRRFKDEKEITPNNFKIDNNQIAENLISNLPYQLTNAQLKVWEEIKSDLISPRAMNRLIQGDVGSGKTILAVMALISIAKEGYQGALMVPTEVLAMQHFKSITALLEEHNINIKTILITGSMTAKQKREAYELVQNGEVAIIVGTHALIQEKVIYKDLALVITDEQHRFGVKQRETLSNKGIFPHIIVMSATPIPRTLAIIMYGDLDISIIDELPANRLPIKNCVVNTDYRPQAYKFIEKEVKAGRQAYVICPMVEENESSDLENVIDYANTLSSIFPSDIHVEYLHGQMKPSMKNDIMERYSLNEIQVLVSTTVIEVGVNVPNATVMMVENAERFGLAGLHQLRGRVGRGEYQSYCIFVSGSKSRDTMKRLEILNTSNDGFYIAGEDLKLRGPGDMFGIRQSGDMNFKLGDIFTDAKIVKYAAKAVEAYENNEIECTKEEQDYLNQRINVTAENYMSNINL